VIRPLADQAEAKALADGLSGSTEPWRIVASGICLGRPDLRAGDLVHIDGLGSRFSGDYAVSAARHTFDPTTGYRTSFDARREPS
jgi:phage protein D